MELHIKKELSIQISLSGFSFCILNRSTSTIEYLERTDFKSKLTPEGVLEALKTNIEEHSELTQTFDRVLVLFQNELSSLVPEKYFEEENASDYLKFSSKIITTDFISYDKIKANQSINVFVPYVNINNHLFEVYGEFDYMHASTIFLENILKEVDPTDGDMMYINVARLHFEMAVVTNGKLQLYNTYDYFTKEDFIYFVLFSIEQLKLNPETLIVKLSGDVVKDDVLYQLLYTYIRHVEFCSPNDKFEHSHSNTANFMHKHALILNSFN